MTARVGDLDNRTSLGIERRQAWGRTRQRARYALRRLHREEYRTLLARFGTEARANGWLRRSHSDDYDRCFDEEAKKEPALAVNCRQIYLDHLRVKAALRKERRAEVALAISIRQLWTNGIRCRVCWGPLPPNREATCGHECAELWVKVRYQIDEGSRETHRNLVARRVLAGEDPTGSVVWARNVLAGTVRSTGRWTCEGSLTGKLLERVEELRVENVAMFGTPGET